MKKMSRYACEMVDTVFNWATLCKKVQVLSFNHPDAAALKQKVTRQYYCNGNMFDPDSGRLISTDPASVLDLYIQPSQDSHVDEAALSTVIAKKQKLAKSRLILCQLQL